MLVVSCPHCGIYIEILEINCRIFRCGIYKTTYAQIPPHLPKMECDLLVQQDLIYGCGRPFMLVNNVPTICDYV